VLAYGAPVRDREAVRRETDLERKGPSGAIVARRRVLVRHDGDVSRVVCAKPSNEIDR